MLNILSKVKLRIVIFWKLLYYKCKYGEQLKIGKNNKFRKRFKINIAKGGRLEIGNMNFWNDDCSINVRDEVIIGNENLFGKNVNLYDHNHIFDNKNIRRGVQFYTNKVNIENNNWFGTNVTILSKANIGSNNVFGAGTVINMKILNDSIVKTNNKLDIKPIIYK